MRLEFASLLLSKEGAVLLDAILEFNAGFAVSKPDPPFGGLMARLKADPRAMALLSPERAGGFFDFEEPITRLALAGGKALEELARKLSCVIFADRISSCVRREEVLALKQVLSNEELGFARGSARFMLGQKARQALCEGFAFPGSILDAGAWALAAVESALPDPVRQRLSPPALSRPAPAGEALDALKALCTRLMRQSGDERCRMIFSL